MCREPDGRRVTPGSDRHPGLALTVAGILFAAVLSLRLSSGTPVDAYSMLYALPVALVATAFGLRAEQSQGWWPSGSRCSGR